MNPTDPDFTHIDTSARPAMVDVSSKAVTCREAIARGEVVLGEAVLQAFDAHGWVSGKGPILDTAIIAGTMAAKKTDEWIPFCHSLPLQSVKISIEPSGKDRLLIEAKVKTTAQTGVEMEAFTAVSAAALTLVDMCKSKSKAIRIENIYLVSKTGGKSDYKSEKDA